MNSEASPTLADATFARSMDTEKGGEMFPRPPVRRRHPFVIGFVLVALCYLFYSHGGMSVLEKLSCHSNKPRVLSQAPLTAKALVPLEAHIMSKCPDAKQCLQELVLPTMQRVLDKVNFTLSYVGTPTDNDGVACMHGPEECLGNIIELCAAALYPDPKIYLGFTMCLAKDYKDIPQRSLVEDCALEHGVEFKKLDECAVRDDGGYGMGLLRDSVRRTIEAGVTKSCTIRLNNEIYCTYDSGTDCHGVNDLVIEIEKLYQSS